MKMSFREWLDESTLRKLLDVPQNPQHHGEGSVYIHSKMVLAQLENAIETLQKAQKTTDSLSNLNLNFTPEDKKVLRLAALLHDIGKGPTTTIEGKPWKDNPDGDLTTAKSIDHESPEHFNSAMRELLKSPLWQKIYNSLSFDDKKDLWFVIRNHMALHDVGFSKRLTNRYMDENGRYRDERRIRLLLVFIIMDRTGRIGRTSNYIDKYELTGQLKRQKMAVSANKSIPAPNDPREFIQTVGNRIKTSLEKSGYPSEVIRRNLQTQLYDALTKKSEKENLGLSSDEILSLVSQFVSQ